MSEGKTTGGPSEAVRYGGYQLNPIEASGLLVEMVPQGARVLDVGCGDGTLGMILCENRDVTVVGLEPCQARAEIARMRGLNVLQTELTPNVAEQLGGFDVVLFADVLEHLVDPTEVLRTASRVLVPGGVVIASVPNVAHWTVRWNLFKGRFEYTTTGIMDSTHLRWYTKSSLLRLFDSAGFSVIAFSSSAGTWLPDYERRLPWRWLSKWRRDRIIRRAVAKWPTVFGCQHIVKAVPSELS